MAEMDSEVTATALNENEAAAVVLAGIARALVRAPERVSVLSLAGDDGVLLTLCVAPEDLEALTGSGGRTARSLRTVLTALGKRSGQRFTLDIQSHTH